MVASVGMTQDIFWEDLMMMSGRWNHRVSGLLALGTHARADVREKGDCRDNDPPNDDKDDDKIMLGWSVRVSGTGWNGMYGWVDGWMDGWDGVLMDGRFWGGLGLFYSSWW